MGFESQGNFPSPESEGDNESLYQALNPEGKESLLNLYEELLKKQSAESTSEKEQKVEQAGGGLSVEQIQQIRDELISESPFQSLANGIVGEMHAEGIVPNDEREISEKVVRAFVSGHVKSIELEGQGALPDEDLEYLIQVTLQTLRDKIYLQSRAN